MVLLPEISLTPQLEARFRARFSAPVAVFHSALADGERRRAWLAMQRGEAAILLGTRSAVFTPMKSPGLIVLDEEHDTSFKQQDGFRFSARDVAVMRARLLNIPVMLGSATPSLESLYNVRQGRYGLLRLPERAGGAVKPRFRVLDIRGQRLVEGISSQLAADIGEALARGEQALLFVNRRGFAPTLICHGCGWVAQCRRCDANLVIHVGEQRLRCHHCGFEQALPKTCTGCGEGELYPLGLGTERVEAALAEFFPEARVARIDRDSTRRKGRLQSLLDDIRAGRIDILIGTQMLAKGHHFPGVTLVGIIDVDAGLYSTDFRAEERTAQLIVQVAGRAGREERPGAVILQTRHPDHPLLQILVREGYSAFALAAAAEREAAVLPPYSYQALWRAEATRAEAPARFLGQLAGLVRQHPGPSLQVLGPAPAPLARRAGRHRWQLLLQSAKRAELHGAVARLLAAAPNLDDARRVRWSIDIDPVDLY
jgi:primosomal protein N' (replication factor Y)